MQEPLRPLPNDLFEIQIARLALKPGDAIEMQFRAKPVRVGHFIGIDLFADNGCNIQLLEQFPGQGGARIFSRLDLATREFPLQRVAAAPLALANKNRSIPRQDSRYDLKALGTHSCKFRAVNLDQLDQRRFPP